MQSLIYIAFFFQLASFFPLADWQDYHSESGRFHIKTPGDFDLQADTVESNIGWIFCNNLTLQHQADSVGLLLGVSYCDYPDGTLHSDSTELMQLYFDATTQNMAAEMDGELLYHTTEHLNGFPAYLWKIQYGNGQKAAKFKSVMVNNRLYMVQARSDNSTVAREMSNRFLGSFRVTSL